MLLVILGHCNYFEVLTPYGGVSHPSPHTLSQSIINGVIGFIYAFHMPFFMALSGLLYKLNVEKYNRLPKSTYFKKKFCRLIIPFFLTTLLVSVPLKYISGYWDAAESPVNDIFWGQFMILGNTHLWFVAALFWIFLFFYPIRRTSILGNPLSWIVLLLLHDVGTMWVMSGNSGHIQPPLGLTKAFAMMIYFAIGFQFLANKNILGCLNVSGKICFMTVLCYIGCYIAYCNLNPDITLLWSLRFYIIRPLIAIGGIFTMTMVSMWVHHKSSMANHRLFKRLGNDSYELYLFSDPFNYVILAAALFLSDTVTSSEWYTCLIFVFRFFATIILAYGVIFLMTAFKSGYNTIKQRNITLSV